jgi:hypothetical protein
MVVPLRRCSSCGSVFAAATATFAAFRSFCSRCKNNKAVGKRLQRLQKQQKIPVAFAEPAKTTNAADCHNKGRKNVCDWQISSDRL